MSDYINWKERYYDLEKQMYDMMVMVSSQYKNINNAHVQTDDGNTSVRNDAKIDKLLFIKFDSTLEVIVVAQAKNPLFIFELINDSTKTTLVKSEETRKNSYRFADIDRIKKFRIKAYIRNEKSKKYTDSFTSRLFN